MPTPLQKKLTLPKSPTPLRSSAVPTSMLASAIKVAPRLIKNGKPVAAPKLRGRLDQFEWFPGGSAKELKQARLDAIKYLYAVSILAKAWPKEFLRLTKELQAEYKCQSRSSIFIRAIIPAPSRNRATSFYSEKKRILEFLSRNRVKPAEVKKYVWDEDLSLTDMLQSARATRARFSKKRTKGKSGSNNLTLAALVGKIGLSKNDRFLAEARYSNGHAVYIRGLRLPKLRKAKARNQRWKRIVAAATYVSQPQPSRSHSEPKNAGSSS